MQLYLKNCVFVEMTEDVLLSEEFTSFSEGSELFTNRSPELSPTDRADIKTEFGLVGEKVTTHQISQLLYLNYRYPISSFPLAVFL